LDILNFSGFLFDCKKSFEQCVSEEPVPPSPVFEDEDLQDVLMQMLAQEQDSTAEENIVSLAD
jgi:hypothetical protein